MLKSTTYVIIQADSSKEKPKLVESFKNTHHYFRSWQLVRICFKTVPEHLILTEGVLNVDHDIIALIENTFYPQVIKKQMQTVFCRNKLSLAT